MKIIRYGRWDDIDVEFLDDFRFIKEHVTYTNFKRGEVKNPYDKNRYDVGNEVLHLDKDIKYPKNTVYSPYSCISSTKNQ